ncbi:acyl-CoA/acyl-ACP dehydrogenase [Rhodococcus sp. USK10]|uniref:acyl-CoA dehydrogenase family protein n=1 Tax=Rhodococcus sp. USK10 TaxID=2789739 RepID=UPI001C603BFA|nr:acyl-CoA dehydrogenase family protein [Rhodococcus sp. USK10]QYB06996.1 acyl-CoA/acyl-ACP dehydrogenase [Rhodococcus sp. USK10]
MTTATTIDTDLVDMMSAVFARHRQQHEPAIGAARWDTTLWAQLDELGLVRLTGSEATGGSGGSWLEAAELIQAAVCNGVRVPVAEHDLLAGWLLETAGMPVGTSRRTVAVLGAYGAASGVPWAREAERIVTVWHDGNTYRVADLATGVFEITEGVNLAEEPRDTVRIDLEALSGVAVDESVVRQFFLRGALIRALQTCAALDRIVELSVAHAGERSQFGRPLAKFQAVQNLVADIAAEAALARAATEAALAAAVRTQWAATGLEFSIAVARSCAGHAASVVVRNAHQVHGAIGTTREHRLHEFTKPALAWRSEFGSVHYWDDKLTDAALAAGRDGLWGLVTG